MLITISCLSFHYIQSRAIPRHCLNLPEKTHQIHNGFPFVGFCNLLFVDMSNLSIKPSIDFRDDLKNVLERASIGQTLKALKECLRPNAYSRNDLTILTGRWQDLNRKDIRGTLSIDEYNKEENKIRFSLIRFIDALPEEEVVTAGAKKEKKVVVKYRAGKVQYFLPNRMQVNHEVECDVKISVEDGLLDQIPSAEGALHQRNISVSDAMSVDLRGRSGSPFDIEALNDAIQLVTNQGSTTWTFYVKPESEGTHLLLLKVAMVKNDQGVFVKKEEVLRERVQVIAQPVEQEAALKKELALSFFLPVVTVEPIVTAPVVEGKSIFQKILVGAGGAVALALVGYLAILGFGGSPDPEPVVVIPPPEIVEPDVVVEPSEEPEEPIEITTKNPPVPPKWPPDVHIPELLPSLPFTNPMSPWDMVFEGKVYEQVNFFSFSVKATKGQRIGPLAFPYNPSENEHIDTIVNGVPYRIAEEVKITNAQNSAITTFSNTEGAFKLTVPDSQQILLVHAAPKSHQAKYQRYRTNGNDIFLGLKKLHTPITVSYDLGNEVLVPAPKTKIAQAYHIRDEFFLFGNKKDIVREIKALGVTDSLGSFYGGFEANYLNENLILILSDNCSDFDTTYTIPASQLSDTAALQLLIPVKGIKTKKIQLKKGKNKSVSSLIPEPALKRKTIKVFSNYDIAKKEKAKVKIGEIKTDERGWFIYKIKPDATVAGVSIELVEDNAGDYYLFSVNPKLFKRKSFELVFKSNLWNIASVIEFGSDFCGAEIRAKNRVLRMNKTPFFSGGLF